VILGHFLKIHLKIIKNNPIVADGMNKGIAILSIEARSSNKLN